MKKHTFIPIFCLLALMIFSNSVPAETGPTYALVHCMVIPVKGQPVEDGIIIIRDGLIKAVGEFGKISVPEDAEVIEAEGLYAYPGLISAHTNLLLEAPPPPSQAQRGDVAGPPAGEKPGWQYPELMAYEELSVKTSTIEDLYKAGITTILVAPERNIFAGQSVILNLRGADKKAMVLKQPFGLHIHFVTARGEYPSRLLGTVAVLRQAFLDTQHYALYKDQFEKSPSGLKRPDFDPFMEDLWPYVIGKKPVVFTCANQEDIKRAIRITKEFDLNGYISGANEAWRALDFVKTAGMPLLVTLDTVPPNSSMFVQQGEELKKKAEEEMYPSNAAVLQKEGLKFALTTLGLSTSSDVMKNIRAVIKAGLPEDEALKAMTVYPAELLGIDDLVGTLEPGKIANVVLATGKIFNEKTVVQKVFVDGFSFDVKQPAKKAPQVSLSVSGKWQAVVDSPMGSMDMALELIQEGNTITGSLQSDMGNWGISDGKLNGNKLDFVISADIGGESMVLEFSGTVSTQTLEGDIFFEGGSAKLKATKIPDGQEEVTR